MRKKSPAKTLRRNSHEANQKNNFFQNTLFFFQETAESTKGSKGSSVESERV
jgi:hypothetical protein